MKPKSIKNQSRKIQAAAGKASVEKYCLRLFVTGTTPKSLRAITNIKLICEAYLKGRYILEVVDIYQQPALAKREQIIASPTLIKKLPLPLRKFIGDMTNTDRILLGLDLCSTNGFAEANGKYK
jgi:circadian clock protein KaiB